MEVTVYDGVQIECRVELRGEATPAAVEAMLQWMYTSEPPAVEHLTAVLSLAEQYQMSKLAVTCGEMISEGMQPSNAAEAIGAVRIHREQPHLEEVWASIRAKFWQCCTRSEELQLSMEKLVAMGPTESAM